LLSANNVRAHEFGLLVDDDDDDAEEFGIGKDSVFA
jgi:hypothetical protein